MGITRQQFNTLEDLYMYYNAKLFQNKLPLCLVNLSRHREAAGFYIHNEWRSLSGKPCDEISINPDTLSIGDIYWHSTLVHEMCHLWQNHFGKTSLYPYHNRQWATKMKAVGLMPTDTGRPGGEETGQNITDYPIKGGNFEKAFNEITEKELLNLKLPYIKNIPEYDTSLFLYQEAYEEPTDTSEIWLDRLRRVSLLAKEKRKGKSGIKSKYTCMCNTTVWGKSGLNMHCNDCEYDFVES